MEASCKPNFKLVCLLAIISSSGALSLPLSDLTPYAAAVQTSEKENMTKQEEFRLHKWKGDDLKAALCPDDHIHDYWDVDVKCTDNNGVYLSIGHCLTYHVNKNGRHFLHEFKCPYFQLKGYQVSDSEPGYIKLPHNISELNDYMCGSMNRKGFLCEECIDNFSVSMTSIGNKCSNCTDVWYGIPLYLIVELVPITAFYLFILVFQIHITSPPMVSFIFYGQTLIFVLTVDRPPPLEKVVPQHERSFLGNLNLFLYSPWNLDFLRYVLPPFCVFEGLSVRHMAVLSYVPVLYSLFLTFLTWVSIKLYDRGFKPIVCVVVTIHKCLVKLRQDWGDKRDVVDVFSAFFLLSYSRFLHQSSPVFLVWDKVSYIHDKPGVWGIKYIMNYDYNITYRSSKYIAIALVSLLVILVFNVLPALLLVLYPFKIVRACLSKCHLDTLCLNAFMDIFHGCYRNGLSGGRDMRSFAGLYFFIRCLFFLYYPSQLYKIHFSFGSYLVLLFLSATLLIAIARPYKETYMNVFDTVILGHFTFMSKILIDDYFKGMGTQLSIVGLIPIITLGICLLYIKIYTMNFRCCRKWPTKFLRNNLLQIAIEDANSGQVNFNSAGSNEIQSLLAPVSDSSGE